MTTFEYKTEDHYAPPFDWELETADGWELVSVVHYKHNDKRYYRAYYKRVAQ